MADHPRSQTRAVLVRLLEAEKDFIADAVDKTNNERQGKLPPVSQRAFMRNGAIELAEGVLGRKYNEQPAPTRKRKAKA